MGVFIGLRLPAFRASLVRMDAGMKLGRGMTSVARAPVE